MRCAFILLFLLLIGCASPALKTMSQSIRLGMTILQTTNQVKYVEVSSERIEAFLSSQGINPKYQNTTDNKFCVVEEAWFTNTVFKEYYAFMEETGTKEYIDERNDCDDYNRAFTFFCKMKSLKTLNINYSMAVADVCYHKKGDKKRNHAINLAIVLDKDSKLKLIYIEPQDPSVFPDNQDISKNVYYWVM